MEQQCKAVRLALLGDHGTLLGKGRALPAARRLWSCSQD